MKKVFVLFLILGMAFVAVGCSSAIIATPKISAIEETRDSLVEEKEKVIGAEVKVTIPEGYHIRQVADLLERKGIVSKEEFLKAAKEGDFHYWFLEGVPQVEDEHFYRLEGFLFPDTYLFYEDTPAEEVIHKMLKRFDMVIARHKKDILENQNSLYDIIRMASVVEREAKAAEERPVIASVFYNRLDKGMKLESCATVQFLFEQQKTRLFYSDLAIDSPFNTYKNTGLPVGPIANPGLSAIKASIYPQNTDYLFFVAVGDTGNHKFARTYEEHKNNIERYRN